MTARASRCACRTISRETLSITPSGRGRVLRPSPLYAGGTDLLEGIRPPPSAWARTEQVPAARAVPPWSAAVPAALALPFLSSVASGRDRRAPGMEQKQEKTKAAGTAALQGGTARRRFFQKTHCTRSSEGVA